MFRSDGHALLIGVDDYGAFDQSMNMPRGTSDLEGSRNDAHVFFRLAMELGMDPANVRVLASPRIGLARLPGALPENVLEANEENLREALGWLADKIAGGRPGLLTYAGHGAHTNERGLLLCPTDVTGAGFDHAVAFTELREIFGAAAENLTIVLDCCHAGAGRERDRNRRNSSLGGDAVTKERRLELDIGARVLAACEPGERAQQAMFEGLSHGAFSWALAAIVDQWKRVDEGGEVRLDVSYGTLVDKARQLLGVLDFPGTPALYGPEGASALAFLQVGSRAASTTTSPDAGRDPIELDGGTKIFDEYKFAFTDTTSTTHEFLRAYAMKATQGSFSRGYEYWFVKTTKATVSALGTFSVSITCNRDQSGTPGSPSWSSQASFSVKDDTSWSPSTDDPYASQGLLYQNGSLAVRLVFDRAGITLETIVWYQVGASAQRHITPSGPFTCTANGTVSAPSGQTIYTISQSTGL